VLWLNSVSTRRPNLGSARDIRKIFRKLGAFFKGPRQVRENFWVYTPLVLPLPHSRWARAVNRRILAWTLRVLRWRLSLKDCQVWTFLPNVNDYLDALGDRLVVYYCVDEWSHFNYVSGTHIAEAEEELCRRADVVFATARSLVEKRRRWNERTHLALHGVDHEMFSRALKTETSVPADIAGVRGPIIGFYGTLQDWVDYKLLAYLAQRHPEWSIVLIGQEMVDLSEIRKLPNVHVLGQRPHATLPAYCKAFDVGIIPYVMNERIRHVNPIKLREYLCAGLPVVSVPLPEVEGHSQFCALARTEEEFERAIEAALANDSPELARQRSAAMQEETWEKRVNQIWQHVMRVKEIPCQSD